MGALRWVIAHREFGGFGEVGQHESTATVNLDSMYRQEIGLRFDLQDYNQPVSTVVAKE